MTKNKVYLSSIFDWFKSDFVSGYDVPQPFGKMSPEEAAVINFISSYAKDHKEYLKKAGFTIDYLDYDWTLNRL